MPDTVTPSNKWEYIDDTNENNPLLGDLRIDSERVQHLYEGLEAFVGCINSANENPNLDHPIVKFLPARVLATFLSSTAGQNSVQAFAQLNVQDRRKFLQRMMGDLEIAGKLPNYKCRNDWSCPRAFEYQ